MKKLIGVVAALAAVLMLGSGCANQSGSTSSAQSDVAAMTSATKTTNKSDGFEIAYPDSMKAEYGDSLKMEKTPEHIVVMTAGPVMTLYKMGVPMLAVPNSSITQWPEDLKAERLPFGMGEIDMEKITALKPDLVILATINKEKYGSVLESQGVSCYYVPAGPTVTYNDIKTEVKNLGAAFGKKAETDKIMKDFTDLETDIATFKKKKEGQTAGVLFAFPPTYMEGSQGYLGDMLKMLGYKNIADKDGKAQSTVPLSMEDFVVGNPDIIFAVSPSSKTGDDLKKSYQDEFKKNPQTWNKLSAVQNGKVVYLGSTYAKAAGINIIGEMRDLMKQLS